jgi:hypothetical protein
MQIYKFKSLPKETPFAPEYEYVFGESYINFINYKQISNLILNFEQENLKSNQQKILKNDGYTGLGVNSLTAMHKYYNLLSWNNIEVVNLKDQIYNQYCNFLKLIGVQEQKVWIQCWANILRNGEYIKPHIHAVHPYTYLGGHVIIQCTETSTVYVNPVNQINDPEIFESKNKVGKFTIFQNCIPHYTTVHYGSTERISVAFDLSVKKDGNNFIELN